MFIDRLKFREQFLKKVTQGTFLWNYFKIWSEAKRRSESSPHSLEQCLSTDQNFANSFWKGSPKEHFCEINTESDQRFQRRKFLKNCLKDSISLPWQPQFLMKLNSVNNFSREDLPRNILAKFGLHWPSSLAEECLKKLLTTHNTQLTQDYSKSSPGACCAQVS